MIRVWKTDYDWIVAIGDDCYEMNQDANQPNGVCIYLGTIGELDAKRWRRELNRTDYIPVGVLCQVANLISHKIKPLTDVFDFVCDCCQTGALNESNPIAPMAADDNRTLGEVIHQVKELL